MTGVYDVTEAFTDMKTPVSILYAVLGGYVSGRWVTQPGTPPTPVAAEAVVHPMSDNEINKLDIKGYNGGELLRFYFTDTVDFNIANSPSHVTSDIIIHEGVKYITLTYKNWKHIGGYHVVYAERMN